MNFLAYLFIFITGCCFGSFANVIIYRYPLQKSLIKPRSACMTCRIPISWYDNIPLLSYVILRGKCRSCRTSIPWRYPLVEILSGLLFLLIVVRFRGDTLVSILLLVVTFSLVCISFIDLDHYIIPDIFSIGLIATGLLTSPINHLIGTAGVFNIIRSITGGLTGGVILLITAFIANRILKKEAMGGGDIKLITGIGTCIGYERTISTIFFASLLGSIIGLGLILSRKHNKSDPIPFGPFLSIGALISILYYDRIFALIY